MTEIPALNPIYDSIRAPMASQMVGNGRTLLKHVDILQWMGSGMPI